MLRHTCERVLICCALLGPAACDDDEKPPEKVAFSGIAFTGDHNPPVASPSSAGGTGDTGEQGGSSGADTRGKWIGKHSKAATTPTGGNIDSCCSALNARAATQTGNAKDRTKQAARMCINLAAMVREGKTSKSSALIQLRSAAGMSLPGACN